MDRTLVFSRRYGIAVGSTALALLVTWILRPLPVPLPALFLLMPVIISTAYGGLGSGLLATACSLFALYSFIPPPTYVLTIPITYGVRLGLFAGVACTVAALIAVGSRITEQLRRTNAELERKIEERTTTLTHAHAAQAESEARYRELFENATDVIYTHDLQGYFTSINKAAERLSGYTRDEATHLHISQIVIPEYLEVVSEMTQRQLAGETLPLYELEIRTKEGQRVPLELHTRLIRHAGQPIGIQGIARDISERKRVEESLRQATDASETANQAKSEFLATMSHELRTPLSVILGYTAMLLDEGEACPAHEQREILQRIDRSAKELLDLITAVLDMSRLEAGRLPLEISAVDVPNLLKELEHDMQGLQDQSQLTFVWEMAAPLPILQTDPGKLRIVLKNLLGNAIKFTEHGSITIRAESQADGITIEVQDTGIGIPLEALTTIFEPFRQVNGSAARQPGGAGLGLAIVQRMVELLGGRINVESTLGSGSTFQVWVPLNTPAGPETPKAT
jgi:PAS domain S-box-containing protein